MKTCTRELQFHNDENQIAVLDQQKNEFMDVKVARN